MKFMHKTTKVSTNLNTDILFQDMINLIIQHSRASQTRRVNFVALTPEIHSISVHCCCSVSNK